MGSPGPDILVISRSSTYTGSLGTTSPLPSQTTGSPVTSPTASPLASQPTDSPVTSPRLVREKTYPATPRTAGRKASRQGVTGPEDIGVRFASPEVTSPVPGSSVAPGRGSENSNSAGPVLSGPRRGPRRERTFSVDKTLEMNRSLEPDCEACAQAKCMLCLPKGAEFICALLLIFIVCLILPQ